MIGVLKNTDRVTRPVKPRWPFFLNEDCAQATGLMYWYPGAPPGNPILYDLRSNNHGYFTGTGPPSWGPGNGGGAALRFNGTDNNIQGFAQAFPSGQVQPRSGGAWINTNSAANARQGIIAERLNSSSTQGWLLGIWSATQIIYSNVAVGIQTPTVNWQANRWNHIFFTDDGVQNGALYWNGRKVLGWSNMSSSTAAGLAGVIGAEDVVGDNPFSGMIEGVTLYNRVLSAGEVWTLYDPQTRWQLRYTPTTRQYFLPNQSGSAFDPQFFPFTDETVMQPYVDKVRVVSY